MIHRHLHEIAKPLLAATFATLTTISLTATALPAQAPAQVMP